MMPFSRITSSSEGVGYFEPTWHDPDLGIDDVYINAWFDSIRDDTEHPDQQSLIVFYPIEEIQQGPQSLSEEELARVQNNLGLFIAQHDQRLRDVTGYYDQHLEYAVSYRTGIGRATYNAAFFMSRFLANRDLPFMYFPSGVSHTDGYLIKEPQPTHMLSMCHGGNPTHYYHG